MRALLQRVSRAEVRVDGAAAGRIDRGILVLLGVGANDGEDAADAIADKCLDLRIFPDPRTGKPDLSVRDIAGGVLVVSQFTLYADTRKGRRPDFTSAAPPALARTLYERFVDRIAASGLPVGTGVFGAMMEVNLVNDGPFTLLVER